MDFEVGQVAGDYEIIALLGAGGMGKVYKVRNTISDRVEAMKILLARLDEHSDLVNRFSREIKVTASLEHPNIAGLHTAHRIGNQLAMIMEFVEGSTLDSLMRAGALPLPQILEIVNQSLAALSYAHSRGVVHRDIKPANIIVNPEGRVKLMDFGIARMAADRSLTKTGQMVGSLYYMSPEQVEGKSLDARSDLYSLGVTLYEMVTSRKPFDGDSDYAILAGHLHQLPRPPIELVPNVPQGLNEIILMALQKDPGQRFQSALAFRGALSNLALEMSIPLSSPAEGSSSSGRSGSSLVAKSLGASSSPGVASSKPAPPMLDTVAMPQARPPSVALAAIESGGTTRGGRRALWMIAGGLATMLILAAAVIYLPRLRHASAGRQSPVPNAAEQAAPERPSPAPESIQTPQQATSAETTQLPSVASTALQGSVAAPSKPPKVSAVAQPQAISEAGKLAEPPVPPPAHTLDLSLEAQQQAKAGAELQKLQDELDMLGARVGAVRSGLDNLQRQQEAQGSGLRADVVAVRQRMELLVDQSQNRIRRGDSTGAKKSLEAAERSIEKLEKFLGR